jgi:xanthine/uracil/vitamin C permease (AzgA family)
MGVPAMTSVNVGLAAVFLGGLLLLAVAAWWSWAGDGVSVPRERWPGPIRLVAMAGWGFFLAGIALQLIGYFGQVGVGRFPPMGPGGGA